MCRPGHDAACLGQLVAELGLGLAAVVGLGLAAVVGLGLAELEQLAQLAQLAELLAQLVEPVGDRPDAACASADDRSAGDPADAILQHRLQILLPAEPEFEGGGLASDAVQPVFPGLRIRLGRKRPFRRLARRGTDGPAHRFLPGCLRLDRSAAARGVPVMHSFQTNGTLIDDGSYSILEANVNLQMTLTAPSILMTAEPPDPSAAGSFDKAIAGIRLLNRHRVPFHVISVLSTASLAAPRDMFDFYLAEGIEQVCFDVEGRRVAMSRSPLAAGVGAPASTSSASFHDSGTAGAQQLSFLREIERAGVQQVIRPICVSATS